MALTGAQTFVILTTQNAMPTQVLEIVSQPTLAKDIVADAIEMWRRFNNNGDRIIIENMISVVLLLPAILLNEGYGGQHAAATFFTGNEHDLVAIVTGKLCVLKPASAIVSTVFTVLACLVVTRVL
jgi:preprotein translocase subunit SecG